MIFTETSELLFECLMILNKANKNIDKNWRNEAGFFKQ